MKKMQPKDIDDLLLAAMASEIIAREFYLDAASKAKSKAGRALFHELAEMEQRHYEGVRAVIKARGERLPVKLNAAGKPLAGIKGEIEGEFEPNKDEIVDLLTRGIEAEKNAAERYAKIAERIDTEADKKIFAQFADDERRHQALLEAEYYQLSNRGTLLWGE